VAPSQTIIRHNITLKGEQNTFEVSFARTSSRKSLKAKRSGKKGPLSVMVPRDPWGWDCRVKGQIKTTFLPSGVEPARGLYPQHIQKSAATVASSRTRCDARPDQQPKIP